MRGDDLAGHIVSLLGEKAVGGAIQLIGKVVLLGGCGVPRIRARGLADCNAFARGGEDVSEREREQACVKESV